MNKQSIELRAGNKWATLHEDETGKKHLKVEPGITDDQIKIYNGGLVPYDLDGNPLKIELSGGSTLYVRDQVGQNVLQLNVDKDGDTLDVDHPRLRLVLLPFGRGSLGNDPLTTTIDLQFGIRFFES
jgi:hypothetical protein